MATTEKRTSQHTPGPWMVDDEVEPSMAGVFVRVHGNPFNGNMGIPISAEANAPDRELAETEMRANARLIAAAPEMLELLRFVTDELAADNGITWLKGEARALLAKIEGRA